MKIGIIGTGHIGQALGKRWLEAGHQVFFSAKHLETLQKFAESLPATRKFHVGLPKQAAEFGEVILLAVPYDAIDEVLEEIREQVNGKIMIDTTNAMDFSKGKMQRALPSSTSAALELAKKIPAQTPIVKAFCSMESEVLENQHHHEPELIGVLLAGNYASSVEIVKKLIFDAGFMPVFAGSLERTVLFELFGPLANMVLPYTELEVKLQEAIK